MISTKSAIELERIGILEPRYPNRTTGIINGKTSGILNWNDIPYPSFYRAYKELSTNYWIPDEVDMKADIAHYQQLNRSERRALHASLMLLASLEAPHNHFIYTVAEYITEPAVHANAAIIGQQEMIHSEGYHYLLKALTGQSMSALQLSEAVDSTVLAQMQRPMIECFERFIQAQTASNLAYALVQSTILETLSFYASFAFFFAQMRHKRLFNSGKIMQLIQRDSQAHSRFVGDIFRALVDEIPSLRAELSEAVPSLLAETLSLQKQWYESVLADCEDLPERDLMAYLENRANQVATILGMLTPYPYADEQALNWMHDYTSNVSNNTQESSSARKSTANNGFDNI